jgi:2-phosphosulfolactate phosphatase
MNIVRARGVDEAASARGSVVVIDVLRAFTTAAYAFAAGAREILLTSTVEEAFALRARKPDAVLVGEVGGRPIAGFDHGNSPAAIRELDLDGATVILRSSSGTQGVVHAASAQAIWLGSLVVASATARALERAPQPITLLAMGSPYYIGGDTGSDHAGGADGAEDDACADILEHLLRGRAVDRAAIVDRVLASTAARQALDPAIDWMTPSDLECALDIDRFDFAMPAVRENGLWIARADTGTQS